MLLVLTSEDASEDAESYPTNSVINEHWAASRPHGHYIQMCTRVYVCF